jgi:hypothetical protein
MLNLGALQFINTDLISLKWLSHVTVNTHIFLFGPITTKVVSLNPAHGKVYSIQHYVIKFISDLQQVLWFPPPIKLIQSPGELIAFQPLSLSIQLILEKH